MADDGNKPAKPPKPTSTRRLLDAVVAPGEPAPPPIQAARTGPAILVLAAAIALFAAVYYVVHTRVQPPAPAVAAAVAAIEAELLEGEGDRHPKLVAGERPPTPDIDIPLAPTIVCRILVDTEGRVAEARVHRPRLELTLFEQEALAAVKQYRFEPALDDGNPVAVWINWPVTFDNDAAPPDATIRMKGSDTIGGELGPALAMAYNAVHPAVAVEVEALGSSTAFVGLFDGSADLGASSRPVKQSELDEAAKLGIDLEEFVIGYDGIAVVVHPDNPVEELSLDDVAQLFRGDIDSWSDLGGRGVKVRRLSRPVYSGTHSVFKDAVVRLGKDDGEFADGTEYIEHSEELSREVAKDKSAIAYLGIGWIGPGVKVVALRAEAGGTAVAPTPDAIRSGDYPLFRPLLVYTRGVPSSLVADFLRFVVSPAGRAIVVDNGFVAPEGSVTIPSPPADAADETAPAVERVYFEKNATALDAAAREQLATLAKGLAAAGDKQLRVVGNADAGGGSGEHLESSFARAESVAEQLEASGFPREHVDIEAANDSKPISSNMTPAGRAANRRVDIFITTRAAEPVPVDEDAPVE